MSVMVDGAPSRSTCRCLSCLEVHKLLQCSSEAVYPEVLNGGFKLIWVPLPKQLVWDMESTNEPAILQVNLLRTTHRDVTMATSQWSSMPISSPYSVTECPSDAVNRPSMEKEVERLLSGTLSNMPEQSCAPVSPRRPPPMVLNTPAASKEEATPDLGEIGEIILVYPKQPSPSTQESSQSGMINVTAHSSCSPSPMLGTLERNSTPNSLELQTNSITLPDDGLHLQGEMNDAMVQLLTFRASVDAHQQRLISESEITHCQNETKASEAINGVEACYAVALCNTEAVYAAAMRGAEATHSASTREAEATHATAVREAEVVRACKPPSYDRPTQKPCMLWKMRTSKRKGTLPNPSCGPVGQLFRPVPMKF